MSMISEQIKELRTIANNLSIGHNMPISLAIERFREAADTIEALSTKLQAMNMERSVEDCGIKQQYDTIMHINTYLLRRYGDKLWEEFNIEKTKDTKKNMISAIKIFDEIYKREKEKYPLMWNEYCLYGKDEPE